MTLMVLYQFLSRVLRLEFSKKLKLLPCHLSVKIEADNGNK